jgi:hypothetical protein
MRVITTGTASNVSVSDPGFTPSEQRGHGRAPRGSGHRRLGWCFIPKRAASPATGNATDHSSSQAGMTYELYTA